MRLTIVPSLSSSSILHLIKPLLTLTQTNSWCTAHGGPCYNCWYIGRLYPSPQQPAPSRPLPLIEYMTVMWVRCTEQDRGLKASTTFCNIHCVGRWIQCNILGLDHTTSFNKPVLQIIHDLMIWQHTICINTTIFLAIITNSTRTRGAKYSHLVLFTRLCWPRGLPL